MKIKAVLFDLDETVLDRSKTLENYLAWESNEYLSLLPEDSEKYTQRFIELDDNGHARKEEVYTALIEEFRIDQYTAIELTQTYNEVLGRFVVEKRHITESISVLKSQDIKTGIVSAFNVCDRIISNEYALGRNNTQVFAGEFEYFYIRFSESNSF